MSVATPSAVLEPIVRSECMLKYVEELNAIVEAETERRERFYDEMTDAEKVEFINGEVIVHSPARAAHLDATYNILTLLGTYVRLRKLGAVYYEKCLCVFPRNDYEPDVDFFGTAKAACLDAETMKFPVPDFVVEVLSDSTEHRDRGIKFRDYEANGVAEYWIVDADAKSVEQYLRQGARFEPGIKVSSGEIESLVVTGFKISLSAIFDPQSNMDELQRIMNERPAQ